ncbi:penicillin-binding transpeptidase domain-containing protein [uncultured Neglectibacter sp.]|uniref:penicillin-binding transpeptidase domain-containing protein n=1 Tax=uncultured Neglectibacter sp. TaxID=1924108 RepID=UPI0034DDEAD7
MAKGNMEKMTKRTKWLTGLMIFVGFGFVLVNLFRWQIVRGEELSARAIDQSLQSTSVPAMRGTIYDATGTKILAQSASVWTVVLEPNYLKDDEQLRRTVSSGLARILEMDENEIYEKTGESSYFSYLKWRIETNVRDEINEFLEQNEIENGVRMIPDYKRYYPYGTVASNILGFTGSDSQGLEGLERYYDQELRGTAGRLVAAKNALGTDMPFEYEQYNGAQDGNNLVLTIDETVQSILEKYLAEGVEKYKIKNGAVAIMMDVNTGGIIGLAVNPNYDPNEPFTIQDENILKEIEALPEEKREEATTAAWYKQWRNKAVSDTYYPGSVFKMCTGAMGLEEGVITEDSEFTCTGNMLVEGVKDGISCWKHGGHGSETFREGLYNSCNPWFIHLGDLLGAETFCKYREAFGFTEQTGIDLPGESGSLYHSVEDMGPAELATEAFGQNFSITPVQMITACAAVANGGYLVKPHVVDRIVDSEGNIVKTADTGYRRQVISEKTSESITSILQYNAASGTANGGYVAGYRVCGKTGTSEKVAKYNEDPSAGMQYIASYCGYAPAEDPQYALLVFFDEPDGAANGGLTGGNAVAGPIFSKIMGEVLPYLGIEAEYTDEEYDNLDLVSPTVTGLSLTEAYAQLEDMGLSYSVIGSEEDGDAVVTQQIPESGSPVPKGGKVVLYTKDYSESDTLVEVPNFRDMDLANASYMAGVSQLQISVSGVASDSATVSLQDIPEGTMVKQGTVISLTFLDNVRTDTFVHLE